MLIQDRINAIKQQLETGVQIVSAPQLFPTPIELSGTMADMCRDGRATNHRILEPSAGTGRLIGAYGAAWHPNGEFVAVEINHTLCENLRYEFPLTKVIHDDFLLCKPDELGYFDRIIMNPPFKNADDIKHILHARTFLKTDGLLVALCAGGNRQKNKLEPLSSYWEPLPAGSFISEGTNVNTVLLNIEGLKNEVQ